MHDALDNNAALPGLISQTPSGKCLMKLSLQWVGLNEEAISVIRHLYAINTTNIRSHQGLTPEISIQAAVKQGCPLSPIIFNLTMEPIIRAILQLGSGYTFHGGSIDVLD